MFKSKSQLTCSYCSRIYKDPIVLPCKDSICREHLSERDVVKQNKIKCKKCNADFGVNKNEFKSNETLKNSIGNQSHLSSEEKSLKHELEESMKKFFKFYDEFNQNRTKLDMDVCEHFHEMRFKIDEHRERLKEKIDDIALAMIDETKKYEAMYLKNLKEYFSLFNTTKSLENEMTKLEDTFRDPNLLIETIREMQQKQEESLNEIQIKLNEIDQVKEFCEETNEFKPNLSLFNQEPLFGSIRLDEFSSMNSFKSQILKDLKQSLELINLCEFSPNQKWSLLYRGTRDGFGSDDFHSKCDGDSNTLTILKAKESGFIFGGFTSVSWDSTSGCKSDPNAFLFSFTNKNNRPVKMKVDPYRHEYAIYCHSELGPTFGDDITIFTNANTTMDSCSRLGDSYTRPQYAYGINGASTLLAGSFKFQLDEIEVYQKE
jgi:hypothetical protein